MSHPSHDIIDLDYKPGYPSRAEMAMHFVAAIRATYIVSLDEDRGEEILIESAKIAVRQADILLKELER